MIRERKRHINSFFTKLESTKSQNKPKKDQLSTIGEEDHFAIGYELAQEKESKSSRAYSKKSKKS